MNHHTLRRASLLLLLPLAGGCVAKQQLGDASVYTLAAWVPWTVGSAGVLGVAAGACIALGLRRTPSAKAGWAGGMMVGAVGLVVLGLAFLLPGDRLEVRPEGFSWTRGIRAESVSFADCERVEMTKDTFRGRFGVENELVALRWHFRDGRPAVSIPLEGPTYEGRFEMISRAEKAGVAGARGLLLRITTLQ